MTIITQVAQQRKVLEQAVSQALELARAGSDAAEVAVTKTTGISVSSRMVKLKTSNSTAMARLALPFTISNVKAVRHPRI